MERVPVCLTLILLAGIAVAGCIDEETGAVVVYLAGGETDKTDGLVIHPAYVRLHRVGASADREDPDGPGWRTLTVSGDTFDLTRFTNPESRALVANATPDAGRYDRIRIGFERVTTADGVEITRDTDTLVVERTFTIPKDGATVIRIQLDVNASLQGQNETLRFAPVVADIAIEEGATSLQRSVSDDGVPRDQNTTDR